MKDKEFKIYKKAVIGDLDKSLLELKRVREFRDRYYFFSGVLTLAKVFYGFSEKQEKILLNLLEDYFCIKKKRWFSKKEYVIFKGD